jgi:hypothetical protein
MTDSYCTKRRDGSGTLNPKPTSPESRLRLPRLVVVEERREAWAWQVPAVVCHHCGLECSDTRNLAKHLRTHTGEVALRRGVCTDSLVVAVSKRLALLEGVRLCRQTGIRQLRVLVRRLSWIDDRNDPF